MVAKERGGRKKKMKEGAVEMQDLGDIYILCCEFSGAFQLCSWRLNLASTIACSKWVI